MAFFKKSKSQNFDFLSGFSWHVPGVGGMFGMLAWLLVGALLGGMVSSVFALCMGLPANSDLLMLISYPVMFIPPMLAAKNISNRNATFETGYAPDSDNFGPGGGWTLALLCMVATLALGWCLDLVNSLMPAMPSWLEDTLENMVSGKLWASFLSVSIMAPIFEEWLCRGTVLRGLLNFERTDSSGRKVRGLAPWLAIVISALFFAVIHMNPWQAVPAFAIGLLMGLVYWKTGSLKLTMLMHFTNNTFALITANIDAFEDADTFLDVLPWRAYLLVFAVAVAFLWWFCRRVLAIPTDRPQGACREIAAQ